jgi:PAS domain S-box-containing protein
MPATIPENRQRRPAAGNPPDARIRSVPLPDHRGPLIAPDIAPERSNETAWAELDHEEVIRALEVRERFLTTILGSLESFFTIDAQWHCRFVNEVGVVLAGGGADELLGRDVREVLSAEVCRQLDIAMRERAGVSFQARAARDDAQVYDVNAYPLTDGGLAVYIRDVARAGPERAARAAAEQRYQELVESVNSAIVRWSSDGKLTYFNEHAERLFGWRADEVLGRHVDFLLPDPDEQAEDFSHLAADIVAQPERYASNVNENVRKDGSRLWIAWTNRALVDESGEVVGVLAVGNDITELLEAQAALRERDEERIAQQERNRLARELHDSVTQALFAATMKAEALTLAGDSLSPRDLRAVEDVWRLTRGALAQMRTMLLELRGERLEEVPIHQLLRQLTEAAESRSSVNVLLTIRGDAPLPPEPHVAVYRVVQEALTNVTRHARASTAWVDLDLGAASVHLLVGDDGCGFDPSAVEAGHVGLKSMRERAAQVEAELDIVTQPGRGTVVTLDWRGG